MNSSKYRDLGFNRSVQTVIKKLCASGYLFSLCTFPVNMGSLIVGSASIVCCAQSLISDFLTCAFTGVLIKASEARAVV